MRNNKHKQPAQSKQNAWQVTGGTQNGDPTVANAGLIALYESWAEHIGMTYADRTYGMSTWFNPNPVSYVALLERRRNEEANHIPVGLYHDLMDGLNTTETAGDGGWGQANEGTINDNISGLTNGQLFSLLTNNVSSPAAFITSLNNSGLITGSNTVVNVNALFSLY